MELELVLAAWFAMAPIGGSVEGSPCDYQKTGIALVRFSQPDAGYRDLVRIHMCTRVTLRRGANCAWVIWPKGSEIREYRLMLEMLSGRPLVKSVIVGRPTGLKAPK